MKMLRSLASRIRRKIKPARTPQEGVWARHFFQDIEHYTLEGFFYGRGLLVITFEHAAGTDQANAYRHGWGSILFRRKQVSHLCIKPKAAHWYRQPGLSEALAALRASGLLRGYARRMTYGASMGGFAAIAYADAVRADTVLALSPQSTLDLNKVPWETRFQPAQDQNWTGPFSDAVGGARRAGAVHVVYDPHDAKDMAHIARLDADNLVHIRTPYLGHGVGAPLGDLGYLQPLLRMVMQDELDLGAIKDTLRNRRTLPRYYDLMLAKRRVKDSPAFTRTLENARARYLER